MNRKILLVDDDDSLRRVAALQLEDVGYEVTPAADGGEAKSLLERGHFDLVITDLKMRRVGGLELLTWIKERSPDTQVIMMTGFATVDDAVAAMKEGAFDFITKPLNYDRFKITVAKAFEFASLKNRVSRLERELGARFGRDAIVHESKAMAEVLNIVEKVAVTEATVLITGESGTGKELIARMIHYNSNRRTESLVTVNCAAIPRDLLESELFGHERGAFTGAVKERQGKFERANGGTLFLDEIGEMPLELQAKLLRALESGEIDVIGRSEPATVDVRILTATNRDLAQQVAEDRFREDLFFRINVIRVDIPPLRKRREDIVALARHFFRTLSGNANIKVEPAVYEELRKRDWPGNVRELRNACERMLLLHSGSAITVADIPSPAMSLGDRQVLQLPSEGYALADIEKDAIRQALALSGGNQSRAAELLRVPRHKFLYRLEKYGLT